MRVIALEIGPDVRALAGEHQKLHLEERPYAPSDIGNAQLVLASTNDRAINRRVADDAHAAHRLGECRGRSDARKLPHHRDDRAGDLVIGITAGGVPSAAVRIRDPSRSASTSDTRMRSRCSRRCAAG